MLLISQVAEGKPRILHCPDVATDERLLVHGSGTHTPIDQIGVSEATDVQFEFRVGEMAVATGGKLFIVWRWPFDWSDLQSDDPEAEGFLGVDLVTADEQTDGSHVELSSRYQWIAGIEPWHHVIEIKVTDGVLQQGDVVRVTCQRWRAPTCAALRARFLMLIDHAGNGDRRRLVETPTFRVHAGSPRSLVAIAPSDAQPGESFEVLVRADDEWGNATAVPSPVSLVAETDHGELEVAVARKPNTEQLPVERFTISTLGSGQVRFSARAGSDELTAISNTVIVGGPSEHRLFWGDLHSGQTEIGCGNGSLAEHYAYGRDCAGLQFITHQANDHYVTQGDWEETRQVTDAFYEPGCYVPLLGCEWSPLTKDGGDRNVFYRHDEPRLRRSDRFFIESEPDPLADVPTAPEFHEAFRDLDVLVNIHVGGRPTNLEWYDQRIERLCEVHSTHGTSEWFVRDALQRGYRVGITAGTDGVMGRPGADQPGRRLIRNVRNGLTAVYAEELTRDSLWEALQARRCYATTGERIRLRFDVDGVLMGGELTRSSEPTVSFGVEGTAALERVDLFKGTDVLKSWQIAEPCDSDDGALVRILWSGTERKGTARLQRVIWDGSLSIDNGELELIELVNPQSNADHADQAEPGVLRWRNSTAGNASGVIVRVRADGAAQLTFSSGPLNWTVGLADVLQGEQARDAGGVGREVRIGPAPNSTGTRAFSESTTDHERVVGPVPYWLRVVQVDQAMAWSSPVYVTTEA